MTVFQFVGSAGGSAGNGESRSGDWKNSRTSLFKTGSARVLVLQHCDVREEEVAGKTDKDEINEQNNGPAEIVPDHRALVANKPAGRHADTRGLRRDRFADLGADRIQRRQQQQRKAEQLTDKCLE